MRVCHMSSGHRQEDDRIYLKECLSLSAAGHEVFIVARGENRDVDGVHMVGCVPPTGRLKRMLCFSKSIYQAAKALDCEVYHFHDPELMPYALKLKKQGKIVIFDSHEDVPAQIMDKTWIPAVLRKLVSRTYRAYETYVAKRIDAVVTATPYIGKQFDARANCVAVINNYPNLNDIFFHDTPFDSREPIACYAGGISAMRGEQVMRDAMAKVEGKLLLAGRHPKTDAETYGKAEVTYLGQVDRAAVNELYGSAVVGLVLLLPAQNYVNSQPIKMYEYMAAGIPFVASDFPLWREVAEKWNCGICTKAGDADEAAEVIQMLFNDREKARQMGLNGRRAVEEEYNWSVEEKKLLHLYESLESQSARKV